MEAQLNRCSAGVCRFEVLFLLFYIAEQIVVTGCFRYLLCQPPITWQVHGISIPQFGFGIRFGACGKLEFMLPECRLSKENPQSVPDSLRPKV